MPPRERQKLQPRAPEYFKGPAPYNPNREPGTGSLLPNMREPWNNPGPGSFWNASAPRQTGNNTGVMAAMANNPMVQQAKGLYQKFDPWIPNLAGSSIGYS